MALAASITMLRRAAYSSLLPRRSLLAATSAAAADVDSSLVVPLSRRFSTSSSAAAVSSREFTDEDFRRVLDDEIKCINVRIDRYNDEISPRFNRPPSEEFPSRIDHSLVPVSKVSTSSSDVASQPANEDLVRMLDVEIEHADKNLNTCDVVPPGFPFRIEKTESKNTVILSRRYEEDEIIKAEVALWDGYDDDNYSKMTMVVTISKESGNSELLFEMGADREQIDIHSLYVKKDLWGRLDDENPLHFDELDEELREGWYEYLEMRGINLTNMNLLLEKKMTRS